MPISQWVTAPQHPLPAAANGVTVTSSATPWAVSAWVEIAASLAFDAALIAVIVWTSDTNTIQFDVEIGKGSAGSETLISTVKGRSSPVISNVGDDAAFPLPIAIAALSSGDRVAARIRTSASSAIAWRVSIAIIEIPVSLGSILTTANPVQVYPVASGFQSVTSGAANWASGSFTTVIASAAADAIIVGCAASGGSEWEMDIAVGGAGSEVVVDTIRGAGINTEATRNNQLMFSVPLDVISSGDRVSVRARYAQSGGVGRSMLFAIMFVEKPL